jgi:hypothetical protein
VTWLFALLERIPPLLSATTRLVRAAKASEPPPPVPLEQGATTYLQGRLDEKHRQAERERIRWIKLEESAKEEPEEEKPEP